MKLVGLSLCSLHSRANPSVLTSIKAGISLEVGYGGGKDLKRFRIFYQTSLKDKINVDR